MHVKTTPSCVISWIQISSPIGKIQIDYCEKGLHYVKQVEFISDEMFQPDKSIKVSVVESSKSQKLNENVSGCIKWFQAYFIDPKDAMKLPMPNICVASQNGTFREKTWLTLAEQVKAGQVISYGKLASLMSSPGASRAVGTAMSNNPIQIIVPCHRVIKSDGSLGNYAKGCRNSVKKWLLDFERCKDTG